MTHLGLADAVDAAEALLQPVRVPGQVVVDHQVRAALKVHALTGGVVGDQEPHLRVVVEGGDGGAAPVARDAAMDDCDAFVLASTAADAGGEILQCIAGLGEDYQLATHVVGRIVDDGVVQDAVELAPLGILAGTP